jgi:hypothetical protein
MGSTRCPARNINCAAQLALRILWLSVKQVLFGFGSEARFMLILLFIA